jgi:hypothetical protein
MKRPIVFCYRLILFRSKAPISCHGQCGSLPTDILSLILFFLCVANSGCLSQLTGKGGAGGIRIHQARYVGRYLLRQDIVPKRVLQKKESAGAQIIYLGKSLSARAARVMTLGKYMDNSQCTCQVCKSCDPGLVAPPGLSLSQSVYAVTASISASAARAMTLGK